MNRLVSGTCNINIIPFYHLYGESYSEKHDSNVHVEDIASRSKGLGWKIKSHRHDKLFQIICTFNDSVTVQLDDVKYELSGDYLVIIPTGVVHSFVFEPNINGYVVSVKEELLNAMASSGDSIDVLGVMQQPKVLSFRDHQQIKRFINYIDLLREELSYAEPKQSWVVRQLVQLLLVTVKRQQQLDALNDTEQGREAKVLLGFKHLIEQHYIEHLTVSRYAQMLHVSVSTLSRLCQSRLNHSPKTIIHERIISEAKRRLIYTKQNVVDIAYTLGFKDPGYFSRFFKQMVGMSAGKYRKSHSND